MLRSERLLILADDFTGACDAAGAFGSSCRTVVLFGAPGSWPAGAQVLAVDLDLREQPADHAHGVIREVARRLVSTDTTVFVKIDSTLRGPVAALVAGALEGTRKAVAMVAPAFPEQSRVLIGGRVYVNGRAGPELVEAPGMVIVDAETTADLQALAIAARDHPEWLLVGSAGLARQLARSSVAPRMMVGDGPLLIVAGTPASATRDQLRHLHDRNDLIVMSTPDAAARDGGEAAARLAETVALYVVEHDNPRAVVLTGGATARAVCLRLGVTALDIVGELEAGIPLGTLQGGPWNGIPVVTKAGGFGRPETLLNVAQALS